MTRRRKRGKRGKTYNCYYCNYSTKVIEEMHKHEEYLHGCFRFENPRVPKSKPKKKIIEVKEPKIPIPKAEDLEIDKYGFYVALNYINKNHPSTIRYFVKCSNCNNTISIIGSPTTRKKNYTNDALMLCPSCGLNMFQDNRDRIAKYMEGFDRDEPESSSD